MDFKRVIKDKRVIYGGGAALALVIVFVFVRSRRPSSPAKDDDAGNSDTGFMYFPTDFGAALGIGSANSASTSDPTASLIDLGKQQVKSQTQLGIAGIGADFLSQIAEKFKTKSPGVGKLGGVSGTFGYDEGGMLDFDFSFKQVKTTPATPKQNVSVPPVRTVRIRDGGNVAGNRDRQGGNA